VNPRAGPISPGAVGLSPERYAHDLAALSEETFDVLIVGGGIVGAGAALDAATRGLRVAIVEAQDWASGTSSRSSKLVHGGLRYLQMLDFALVREALRERAVLLRVAPHLVEPLPILYPFRHRVVERAYVTAGVLLYDILARTGRTGAGLPFHRQLSRRKGLSLAPSLDSQRYVGAIQYYDAQVDDARYTLSVVRTAVSHGAVAVSRARVVGVLREQERVVGVRLEHAESGATIEARARVVVSATGAWTEHFEELAGLKAALKVRPSKGVHLVVPKSSISSSTALILPTERSVLFVLPWGEHWVIGTTDTTWGHDLARPATSSADISYLLARVNSALAKPIARSDVESVFVGLRPLIASAGEETTKLSREHAVNRAQPGLVLISGGKYTTYRVMAQDVIDAAVEHGGLAAGPCQTAQVRIVGADGFEQVKGDAVDLAARYGIPVADIERLLGRYGGLIYEVLAGVADDPSLLEPVAGTGGYRRAEIVYAVLSEGARHIEDALVRRTRTAMETRDRGASAAAEVAAIMAPLLNWDPSILTIEVKAYIDLVAAELAAEQEADDDHAAARLSGLAPLLPLP
jgi:glycerol-3-phosphate dehydrogenase